MNSSLGIHEAKPGSGYVSVRSPTVKIWYSQKSIIQKEFNKGFVYKRVGMV